MSNDLLKRSGFCLSAVDIVSSQIEAHINQSLSVKPIQKFLGKDDHDAEKFAISNSIDTLKALSHKISDHDENDPKSVNLTQDSNYCGYYALQFYGKDLPVDLTISPCGFLMRRKFQSDIMGLTTEFKTLLCDKNQKINGNKLKMITVNGPDVRPEDKEFATEIYHDQDLPLVCITFDIEPMNLDIYNAYCPRQEQLN